MSRPSGPHAQASTSTVSTPTLTSHDLLQVFQHSDTACILFCGLEQAAGFNLYSTESKVVPVGGRVLVDTQLSILVSEGTYGRIAPHSGLAVKFRLTTGAGVINPDYCGKVHVLLFNLGKRELEVSIGDHIAQLILEHVTTPMVTEVDDLNSIPSEMPAS